MHVIFIVPMLDIRSHFGMSVGEFTTKHLRLGNYVFDVGGKSRRFIPQAMCLLEEYSDEDWARVEEARAEAEAKKKAEEEAAKKRLPDPTVVAPAPVQVQEGFSPSAARPWWKKLLGKAKAPVEPFKG
jgi:hypothetical protein